MIKKNVNQLVKNVLFFFSKNGNENLDIFIGMKNKNDNVSLS